MIDLLTLSKSILLLGVMIVLPYQLYINKLVKEKLEEHEEAIEKLQDHILNLAKQDNLIASTMKELVKRKQ